MGSDLGNLYLEKLPHLCTEFTAFVEESSHSSTSSKVSREESGFENVSSSVEQNIKDSICSSEDYHEAGTENRYKGTEGTKFKPCQICPHKIDQCHLCSSICVSDQELDNHLNKTKTELLNDPTNVIKTVKDTAFCCDKCGLSFEFKSLLESHKNRQVPCVDRNILIFKSEFDEVIDYKDSNGRSASITASEALNIMKTECIVCSFKPKKLSNLRRHFVIVHCKGKPFKCKYCTLSFKVEYFLNRHLMKVHATKEFPALSCEWCNKHFSSEDTLKSHQVFKCESRVKHTKCDTCGYTSKSNAVMLQHQRKHSREKKYKCPHCGLFLASQQSLNHHLDLHTKEAKYKCGECDLKFKTRAQCNNHEKSHTDNNNIHQCPLCQKTFGYKSSLEYHLMTHSGLKPFVCETCGEAFRKKDRLLSHIKRHSTVIPYPCKICEKDFVTSESLRVHLLSHGERSFTCDRCGKSFYRRDKLTQHVKTHEKRHCCEHCSKKFRYLTEVKRHVKEQHKVTKESVT